MSVRQCTLKAVTSLEEDNIYADIEVCTASRRIFVLAADLRVKIYDLFGRYLGLIEDFADLFYRSDEIATTSDLPLLALASEHLVLVDSLTGTVAAYSLQSERIVFAKETRILPFSIGSAWNRRDALISCAKTGSLYRFDVETRKIALFAEGRADNPFLLCATKTCWAAIDRSTATITLHGTKQPETTDISFWPGAMRRDEAPPDNGSYVFGTDCSCDGQFMVILHGRGGELVPSFWTIAFDTLEPEQFWVNQDYEPLRVAISSNQSVLFLCRDERFRYCICACQTLPKR